MDISNDWRLLNDIDNIKGEYLVAMTGNEIIELYPELKHCTLCWDKVSEERIGYNQIWFINQKRDACVCDKCYQDFKGYLGLKEIDDLYYEFHYPSCGSVNQMKEKNKREYTGTRDEIISQGYAACKKCYP